jgi:hypothetical protein
MKEIDMDSDRVALKQHHGPTVAKLTIIFSCLLVLSSCTSVAEPVAISEPPTTDAPTVVAENAPTSDQSGVNDEASAPLGTFKVSVTDFDENPAEYPEFEVWIRNYGSWFPSFEFGGDLLESVGPFPVGELVEGDMFIYPFGRDGLEISVPILLTEGHISDSDRDMLRIYIEDETLTVFGVVDGLEITHDLG